MKLLLFLFLTISGITNQNTPNDSAPDPKGVFDYSMIERQGHPRLFAHAEDFEVLKKKTGELSASNPVLTQIHNIIMDKAKKLEARPEDIRYAFDASNKRLLPMAKKVLRAVFHLSYAYRLSGETKYLNAAKALLMKVCEWKDWNDAHFLDTGEMTLAVAIGYDWLYHELNLEEKALIEKRIKEYSLERASKHWFRKVQTNWNQVCFDGVVAGAIVTYEKNRELSAGLIEECVVSNKKAMEFIYAPDGAYPEGYMYWLFGTQHEVLLLTAIKNVFGHTAGLEDSKGFDQTGKYMLYMSGINRQPFSYCDFVGIWHGQIAVWYFAAKNNDPSMLCNEFYLLNSRGKYPDGGDSDRMIPIIPFYAKDLDLNSTEAQMPSRPIWAGRGENPVVLVHTGWRYDENDKYLGAKGGKASMSHGHMDAGSFVYDAFGKRWSEDLGREPYVKIELPVKRAGGDFWNMSQESLRWQVYRYTNYAHSTITINDAPHLVNGEATLDRIIEKKDSLGGCFNLSAALADQAEKVIRTVALVRNSDLVVIDRISARKEFPARVQWRMLTKADVSAGRRFETLTIDGIKMKLSADVSGARISPAYKSWPAARPEFMVPRTWDTPNENYRVAGYEVTIPAGKSVTLTTRLSPM